MKKLKKMFSIIVMSLLFVSLLAGCGTGGSNTGSNTKGSKKTIGVCMYSFSDQFQIYLMDAMKKYAATLNDVEVTYMDAKADGQTQISQVESLITKKVDAIVLFPVDDNTASVAAKEINDAKIPLVAVNRQLPDPSLGDSFVGSDDVKGGEMEMTALAEAMNGKGNIVVLNGTVGTPPQLNRRKGYDNILKKYPDIKVVEEQTAEWVRDKGMKVMEDILQSKKQIDGVIANNDEMALGAAIAIKDAGLKGKIKVVGVDGTPEGCAAIKAGELTASVLQDANGQGSKSIETAYKLIKGETVEKEQFIPFQLITADNVDKFIKK